jgi:hypothetical protein
MIPLDVLRGFVTLFLLFFAHFLGRSVVRARSNQQRWRSVAGWAIRATIAVLAIVFKRGLDSISIAALLLSAGAFALGYWDESRPKQEEDLTRQIFGG